ncbi:MAG: sulfite exporter TauE/SafE family protein, partial [Kofleriaceae bacterium]|nr:sulfite exporter TauE/SafE family protein [Kofleriaceae bacterium]
LAVGTIAWQAALVVAIGSLVGGYLGGMIASRAPEAVLRWIVVGIAFTASAIYFARL